MTEREYKQYCNLQEQVRAAGFPQDFDTAIKAGILEDRQHFNVGCIRWGELTDNRTKYDLNFYKVDGSDEFTLDHFHTIYRRNIVIPNETINGVNLSSLEDRMRMVNWNYLTQTTASRDIFEASREQMFDLVNTIIDELDELARSPKGQKIRNLLETKYFSETGPLKDTVSHQRYDKINIAHEVVFTVPFKGTETISCELLDDVFEKDLPLPNGLERRHDLFKVEVLGYNTIDQNIFAGFETFYEERYFSTLKNAVDHMQQFTDQEFQPYHLHWSGQKRLLQEVIVVDEVRHQPIASKSGVWNSLSALVLPANIVQWEVKEGIMSVDEFVQRSGLDVSKLGRRPDDPNIFQVFPPLDAQQEQQQQINLTPKRKIRKQDKGRGKIP